MPSKAALAALAAHQSSGPPPLSDDVVSEILMRVKEKVQAETLKSDVFDEEAEALICRFETSELKIGKKLGQGGYCTVSEITSMSLSSSVADLAEEAVKDQKKEYQTRKYMSQSCIRNGDSRYALKILSPKSLADKELLEYGVKDLALEAKFLAVIQHPNIVKIRGIRLGDSCDPKFFLVLDRLYDTLETKIAKWKEEDKNYNSVMGKMKGGKEKALDLFVDRVQFAWDIANAMEYIHTQNIIYRDLKAENLGFDVRGDVKLFDFGLAKKLHDHESDNEGNFKLTGYTGSPIYMAPEILGSHPYNLSADVYSYSILLWQMISLDIPYKKVPRNLMEDHILKKHLRPAIDKSWNPELAKVMESAWNTNSKERPSFMSIKKSLFACLNDIGGLNGSRLNEDLDKSTRSFRNLKLKL